MTHGASFVVNSTKTLDFIPDFLNFFRRLYAPVSDHVTPVLTLAKMPHSSAPRLQSFSYHCPIYINQSLLFMPNHCSPHILSISASMVSFLHHTIPLVITALTCKHSIDPVYKYRALSTLGYPSQIPLSTSTGLFSLISSLSALKAFTDFTSLVNRTLTCISIVLGSIVRPQVPSLSPLVQVRTLEFDLVVGSNRYSATTETALK
jgi:hypothetical protein